MRLQLAIRVKTFRIFYSGVQLPDIKKCIAVMIASQYILHLHFSEWCYKYFFNMHIHIIILFQIIRKF